MNDVRQWFGAYPATVVRNDDPLGQQRVTLKIPQVLGTATSQWAGPASAKGSSAPAVGTVVTAMFLGGDINHPVYLSVVTAGSGSSTPARMPWNVLGGWSGSTYDLSSASPGSNGFGVGVINVAAVVTDGTVPFSSVGMFVQSPQPGTGTLLTVTDASGNHLASGTNVDTVMTKATADLYYVTLSATITPPAAQTVYYVAFLWPSGVAGTANLVVGGGANWELTQSAVSHISWANTPSATNTTIPNPLNLSSLTGIANLLPFFGLK